MKQRREHASRSIDDERGAIAIVVLMFAVFAVATLYYLMGIGQALLAREHLQDAADAVAFTSAVFQARGMNLIALLNTTMALMLAVLVALRLAETMLIIATAALAAANFAAWGTLTPVVAEMALMAKQLEDTHRLAKKQLTPMFELLHTTEVALRAFAPIAAEVAALQLLDKHYAPITGAAIPTRLTLPVQSAPYAVLCERAGMYVADIAITPFRTILAGPVKFIPNALEDALRASIEAAPGWFCDIDDGKLSARTKKSFPSTPGAEKCVEGIRTKSDSRKACDAVHEEIEATTPDAKTGACTGKCVLERHLERAKRARDDCNPNEHSGLRDFVWQESTVDHYLDGKRKRAVDVIVESHLRTGKAPPCPRTKGGYAWNTKLHPDDDEQRVLPVCKLSSAAPGPYARTREVSHVFSCERTVTLSGPVEGAGDEVPKRSDDDSKSPLWLEPGTQLGDEAFQMRAIVLGEQRSAANERIVRVASWGKAKDEHAPLPFPKVLSRLQVAQAEYYFGGKDLDTAMWDMDWKARLRRFRAPSSSLTGVMKTACENALGESVGKPCGKLVDVLSTLDEWVVH